MIILLIHHIQLKIHYFTYTPYTIENTKISNLAFSMNFHLKLALLSLFFSFERIRKTDTFYKTHNFSTVLMYKAFNYTYVYMMTIQLTQHLHFCASLKNGIFDFELNLGNSGIV